MRFFVVFLGIFLCFLYSSGLAQSFPTPTPPHFQASQKTWIKKEIKSPKKAILYGLIPSGGQIYNEKWWQVPIVLGGMFGLYKMLDFYQRYVDLYSSELDYRNAHGEPLNKDIAFASNESIYTVLKRASRMRNYAIAYLSGAYILQIIWAYVDARLTSFDISDDLSLKLDFIPTLDTSSNHLVSDMGFISPRLSLKINL